MWRNLSWPTPFSLWLLSRSRYILGILLSPVARRADISNLRMICLRLTPGSQAAGSCPTLQALSGKPSVYPPPRIYKSRHSMRRSVKRSICHKRRQEFSGHTAEQDSIALIPAVAQAAQASGSSLVEDMLLYL